MWQILVFVCLKMLFVFLKMHFLFILVFLPLGNNIWNDPGNNILTSIKLPSLRLQREADAGGRKSGCHVPSSSAIYKNMHSILLKRVILMLLEMNTQEMMSSNRTNCH